MGGEWAIRGPSARSSAGLVRPSAGGASALVDLLRDRVGLARLGAVDGYPDAVLGLVNGDRVEAVLAADHDARVRPAAGAAERPLEFRILRLRRSALETGAERLLGARRELRLARGGASRGANAAITSSAVASRMRPPFVVFMPSNYRPRRIAASGSSCLGQRPDKALWPARHQPASAGRPADAAPPGPRIASFVVVLMRSRSYRVVYEVDDGAARPDYHSDRVCRQGWFAHRTEDERADQQPSVLTADYSSIRERTARPVCNLLGEPAQRRDDAATGRI